MKQLRIVMVGDVDAGKSTILGRLLVDVGQVTEEKLRELESSSAKRGVPIEYSFLLDAFQVERDQAITLDVSRVWVRTRDAEFVFVDAPGHRELIRNLLSGASEVDAPVMVVAADEGITPQTRKQALFLQWLGFRDILVAINKLDLAQDPQAEFQRRKTEVAEFLAQLDIIPHAILPVAARNGDNVVTSGSLTAWWSGPTLLEALKALERRERQAGGPLRFLVQDVYRRDGSRFVAGRVESGELHCGDYLTFWPLQTGARVTRIVQWPRVVERASAGSPVAIELDSRVFVDRGAVGSRASDAPELGHVLQARVVWLGADSAKAGETLRLRLGTREIPVTIQRIDEVIDPETIEPKSAEELRSGDVAIVTLVSRELIAADVALGGSSITRFILVRNGTIVAGGRVDAVVGRARGEGATNVVAMTSSVETHERSERNGHGGGVFWLTGLPSAGKSTVAMAVQRMLFERGRNVYVLDGDTLRTTLNVDLGFSDEDRAENVRRTAAVAGVFADAGFIVICALISPFAADRELARAAYPNGFNEIYVSCDLATAERRDVKGHYQRARRGELAHFTGVSSPYEIPKAPDFVVDTTSQRVEESAAMLLEYIEAQVLEPTTLRA
ncbi:MAG: adenylyl-sulfate kinase [Candidatus Eremiobacteraeota bacterium]|nr:adenylyl-sulfate kinase [Candidatus Eremiobacteraeota bacterium]